MPQASAYSGTPPRLHTCDIFFNDSGSKHTTRAKVA